MSTSRVLNFLLNPVVSERRKRLRKDFEPKLQVYNLLSEILVHDPILHLEEFNGDFLIDKRSTLFRRVITRSCYEPKLVQLALKYVDQSRDVIDVGANIGFYTILLAKHVNENVRLLSIEPTPNAIAILKKNLELNKVLEKVIVFEGVVSDKTDIVNISVVPGKEEYSSIGSMSHDSIISENYINIEVKSATLDSLIELHGLNPGFVKIDVEGVENLVLNGSSRLLEKYRPVILTEVSDNLLLKNGFSAQELFEQISFYEYKIIDAMYPERNLHPKLCTQALCLPKTTSSKLDFRQLGSITE